MHDNNTNNSILINYQGGEEASNEDYFVSSPSNRRLIPTDNNASQSRFDAIPESLRQYRQWCNWRQESRGGGVSTKVPYQINGERCSVSDSSHWTDFSIVIPVANSDNYDGIGFIFTKEDPFLGIDMDGCRNPETGEIAEWAKPWIKNLDSYTEISPSGTGVKIILKGKNPNPSGKSVRIDAPLVSDKTPGVELYDHGRYFTITGLHLDGTPIGVLERQSAIEEFSTHFFPVKESPNTTISTKMQTSHAQDQDREKIIDRARNYLLKVPPAISGHGGHDQTFNAVSKVIQIFNLTEEEALLVLQEWNQRCEPQWTDDELLHKIRDAIKNANHFENRTVPDESKLEGWLYKSNPEDWKVKDLADFPSMDVDRLEWIVEPLIPKGGIGFMAAPPKTGKSLAVADLIMHLVFPQHLWMNKFKCNPTKVLYICREDPERRLQDRLVEFSKTYGINLYDSPRGSVHFLIRETICLTDEKHLMWLEKQVREFGYELVILDVLNRMIPGVDESSGKEMSSIINLLEGINRRLNVALLLVDHTRKPSAGRDSKRNRQEPNPFDLRGSISKYGCADFMFIMQTTPKPGRIIVYSECKDHDTPMTFLVDISKKDQMDETGTLVPKFQWVGDALELGASKADFAAEKRLQILSLLKEGICEASDISQKIGLSRPTVLKHLKVLEKDGEIRKEGANKNTRYLAISTVNP